MECKKKLVTIHIGEYYASSRPVVISTILGSCVAVCLRDEDRAIGGMNHILLPGRADFTCFNATARYAVNAMELLINRIMALGGSRHSLTAKIFGGARILGTPGLDRLQVGRKNVEFVTAFLNNEKIPILGQDIGGVRSRKIHFDTDFGDVFLKCIGGKPLAQVWQQEKKWIDDHKKDCSKTGPIILF